MGVIDIFKSSSVTNMVSHLKSIPTSGNKGDPRVNAAVTVIGTATAVLYIGVIVLSIFCISNLG